MAQVADFYRTLLAAQAGYLSALRELSICSPELSLALFGISKENCSALSSQSEEDWNQFLSGIKHWILKPRKDSNNNCLFEFWLGNLNSCCSISGLMNDKVSCQINISDALQNSSPLRTVTHYQFGIIQSICMCVLANPLFTKGLLFLSSEIINKIEDNYLLSNKVHFYNDFAPIFILENEIATSNFFKGQIESYNEIQFNLFSIKR